MKLLKNLLVFVLTLALLLTSTIALAQEDVATETEDSENLEDISAVRQEDVLRPDSKYRDYLEKHSSADYPQEEIRITAAEFTMQNDAEVTVGDYAGRSNVLLWDSQKGTVEWTFNVPKAGLYNIGIEYNPLPGRNTDIEMAILINNEILFVGADSFPLFRTWENETNEFEEDGRGNQLRPKQFEVFPWSMMYVMDENGLENDPYYFYFEQGENTIALEAVNEALAIDYISLKQSEIAKPYEQPQVQNPVTGFMEVYQAEQTKQKSDPRLYPTEERGDPSMKPSHPFLVQYNTIGKNTFVFPGQWISWDVEVPKDGYYNLAYKVKQDAQRGMNSSRRIYVNGTVQFDELNRVEFPYSIGWYNQVVGDDDGAYLVYLEEGVNEIKMEVVTGNISYPLREVEQILYELNVWYRKIIMITGSNPDSRNTIDLNRDYLLDQKIPGLIEGFVDIASRLAEVKDRIDEISTSDGNTASILDEIILQLEQFIERPDQIPRRLDHYKGNVSTLSYTVLNMREQPLELDYFVLFSPDMIDEIPSASTGFFETIAFRFRMFVSSFVEDYSSVGEVYDGDPLNVWVSTGDIAQIGTTGVASGRDQAQVVKSLVDDLFVPETGIGVNLSLVNSGEALIQAVLAGMGPDAAMFIPKELPVNLAVRGALHSIDHYPDFDEVTDRFFDSAMIPYYFEGKAYALPETQNFDMMFIRTDVFEELGLEVPTTWEEFYAVAAILNINNMIVGILENIRTFEMFVYQHDGSFYNERLTQTAFDTPEALAAFRDWTGLYARHSLPLAFDFFSRFRTGEMPISIMPYTQVNWLTAAAPEIRNLWTIAPVPGVEHEDGTINNAITSTGTASIVINGSGVEDEGYQFIRWWTSNEVQGRFGNELEQLMGPSARYPTANKEAFAMLPWSREQGANLLSQWERVTDNPQVPGNYYITRNIQFAFRNVVYDYENERETLNRYNRQINKEIERKRIEFGLDVD